MVVIECPHCDEDIELDDDAFGLFDCPYCENEFEWGTDAEEDFFEGIDDVSTVKDKISKKPDSILIEYSDNPALRITAGVLFSIVMGLYAISSLMLIFTGFLVSDVEGAVSGATDGAVDSGVGAIIILLGFVMLAIYSTGIFFGVQMSKGKFSALIVCLVVSAVSLILEIVSWANSDSDECIKWEEDPFFAGMETCVDYGTPAFPVLSVIIWVVIIAMLASLVFVPKFRSQFH